MRPRPYPRQAAYPRESAGARPAPPNGFIRRFGGNMTEQHILSRGRTNTARKKRGHPLINPSTITGTRRAPRLLNASHSCNVETAKLAQNVHRVVRVRHIAGKRPLDRRHFAPEARAIQPRADSLSFRQDFCRANGSNGAGRRRVAIPIRPVARIGNPAHGRIAPVRSPFQLPRAPGCATWRGRASYPPCRPQSFFQEGPARPRAGTCPYPRRWSQRPRALP